jgi:hypothetical protein
VAVVQRVDFSEERTDFLHNFSGLPYRRAKVDFRTPRSLFLVVQAAAFWPHVNGTPSNDHLGDIFAMIDAPRLPALLRGLLAAQTSARAEDLAIDRVCCRPTSPISLAAFKLLLRQTESLTAVLMLISLTLKVPDHNTMSGRASTFCNDPRRFSGAISINEKLSLVSPRTAMVTARCGPGPSQKNWQSQSPARCRSRASSRSAAWYRKSRSQDFRRQNEHPRFPAPSLRFCKR